MTYPIGRVVGLNGGGGETGFESPPFAAFAFADLTFSQATPKSSSSSSSSSYSVASMYDSKLPWCSSYLLQDGGGVTPDHNGEGDRFPFQSKRSNVVRDEDGTGSDEDGTESDEDGTGSDEDGTGNAGSDADDTECVDVV